MASSSNSPCAACKFQRRKCTQGCVFAPYFPPENPQKFASVHRVFGASNVAKLLNELPHPHREEAVNSLTFEADARLQDPVCGCVGHISILQQKLKLIQHDLEMTRKELSAYMGPAAFGTFLPPYQSPLAAVATGPFHHPPQHAHHHSMHGASTSSMPSVQGMGMGLGLTSAGVPQMLLREQQQQQQQLAMAAAVSAREQEILRSLEQQQQNNEMGSRGLLFNHQEMGRNGEVDGGMVVVAASGCVASPPSGLELVSPTVQEQFDNPFHVHHQQQQQHNLQLEQYLEDHQRTGSDQKAVSEEGGVASAVRYLEI